MIFRRQLIAEWFEGSWNCEEGAVAAQTLKTWFQTEKEVFHRGMVVRISSQCG